MTNLSEITLKLTSVNDCYGFNLTRMIWDPYPKIDKVEDNSLAHLSGIQVGDFIVKINNQSLLGFKIDSIVNIVKTSPQELNLTIWRSDLIENPFNTLVSSILGLIGCPVCTSSVAKLPRQCRNGHVICTSCVVRTDKCPICRAPLGRPIHNARALPGGRCLIAEQLTTILQASGFVITRPSSPEMDSDSNTMENNRSTVKKSNSFTSKFTDLWRKQVTNEQKNA